MPQIVTIDDLSHFRTYLLDRITVSDAEPIKRPLMIVIPGGAYLYVSLREGDPVAHRFNANGYHVIVLNYTVIRQKNEVQLNELLEQVKKCLDWAQLHAEEFGIDVNRISVCGFSAGGHLASWASITYPQQIHRAILVYPAVGFERTMLEYLLEMAKAGEPGMFEGLSIAEGESMVRLFGENAVDALHPSVPPTFLWSTLDDETVPYTQSVAYVQKLREFAIPCELHLYQQGGHGLSLANVCTAESAERIEPHVATWFDLAIDWLASY